MSVADDGMQFPLSMHQPQAGSAMQVLHAVWSLHCHRPFDGAEANKQGNKEGQSGNNENDRLSADTKTDEKTNTRHQDPPQAHREHTDTPPLPASAPPTHCSSRTYRVDGQESIGVSTLLAHPAWQVVDPLQNPPLARSTAAQRPVDAHQAQLDSAEQSAQSVGWPGGNQEQEKKITLKIQK